MQQGQARKMAAVLAHQHITKLIGGQWVLLAGKRHIRATVTQRDIPTPKYKTSMFKPYIKLYGSLYFGRMLLVQLKFISNVMTTYWFCFDLMTFGGLR